MQTNLRMKTLKTMIKDVEPNKYILEADKSPDPGHRGMAKVTYCVLLLKQWDRYPRSTERISCFSMWECENAF